MDKIQDLLSEYNKLKIVDITQVMKNKIKNKINEVKKDWNFVKNFIIFVILYISKQRQIQLEETVAVAIAAMEDI